MKEKQLALDANFSHSESTFKSFDVHFGVPHSLENLDYDFISFKLFSSGYKRCPTLQYHYI